MVKQKERQMRPARESPAKGALRMAGAQRPGESKARELLIDVSIYSFDGFPRLLDCRGVAIGASTPTRPRPPFRVSSAPYFATRSQRDRFHPPLCEPRRASSCYPYSASRAQYLLDIAAASQTRSPKAGEFAHWWQCLSLCHRPLRGVFPRSTFNRLPRVIDDDFVFRKHDNVFYVYTATLVRESEYQLVRRVDAIAREIAGK